MQYKSSKIYEWIFFDLDGTLTDPAEGITRSIQYALDKMDIQPPLQEELLPFIGPPLLTSFKEYYHMSETEALRAIAFYREYFSARGMYENKVYAGIPELLTALCAAGKKLMVVTSKPTIFSTEIIRHFSLWHFFQDVVGSTIDGSIVEKGDVIAEALKKLPLVSRRNIIMIGDRKYDIVGAREQGLDVVAVAYGYGSEEELKQKEPDYFAKSVYELGKILL